MKQNIMSLAEFFFSALSFVHASRLLNEVKHLICLSYMNLDSNFFSVPISPCCVFEMPATSKDMAMYLSISCHFDYPIQN